jgi:hypothetical protein
MDSRDIEIGSSHRTAATPAPANPRLDETLIHALARAHRWKRMLEQGKYRSVAELTEAEGLTPSFVNRLPRLTLLSPVIVEAILDGRQPKALQLEDLTRALPSAWDAQRKSFSADSRRVSRRLRWPPINGPLRDSEQKSDLRESDVGESARLANSRSWGEPMLYSAGYPIVAARRNSQDNGTGATPVSTRYAAPSRLSATRAGLWVRNPIDEL